MKKDIQDIQEVLLDIVGQQPTIIALEKLINTARIEAVGWCHARACVDLDNGKDPRNRECSKMIKMIESDLQIWEYKNGEKEPKEHAPK